MLIYLEHAVHCFQGTQNRLDEARTLKLLGIARSRMGDNDGGLLELERAKDAFSRAGYRDLATEVEGSIQQLRGT